jgi:hypothetical protein
MWKSSSGGELSFGKLLFFYMLFGWISLFFVKPAALTEETLGRDTSVDVPLRVSSDVRESVCRLRGQSRLKKMLRCTPIYAKLLKEFPRAVVKPVSLRASSSQMS